MNLTKRIFNIRIALFAVLLIAVGYLSPPANAEEEEWKLFLNETPNESWYGYEVRCFLEDGEYMWVGDRVGVVFKIHKETLKAVDTLLFAATDMTYDREGNIWFVGAGLKKLVGDTLIGWDQNNYTEIGLPGYSISQISIDSTGKFWLAMSSGLVDFDGQSSKLYDDTNAPFKKFQKDIIINSLLVDKNNNIWVTAALVSGIMKYDQKEWTLYDSTNSEIKSLLFEALAVDNNNIIWVGSSDGIYKYDGNDWVLFKSNISEITGKVIFMAFDKENNLWCTTDNSIGLVKFDGFNWNIFNQSNSPILGNHVGRIYVDKKQNVWFRVSHAPESGEQHKGTGVNIYKKGGVILDVNESLSNHYQVIAFPNPVNDNLTINSETEYFSYEVLDLKGISVLNGSMVSRNSINVSSLVSGTYCLRLISGQSFKTVFFIKN